MNIIFEHDELTLDSPVMVQKPECTLVLEFTSMRGVRLPVARSISVMVPNDRQSLPEHPTLRDVVMLVIKRQHPAMQYVAEQKGVRVQSYFERYSFHQVMGLVEFGTDGVAKRIIP